MADSMSTHEQLILARLAGKAIKLGATSSAIILSEEIQVKEELAALCSGDYTCPNYGLSAGCPPHVQGPAAFRTWQAESKYAITLKIEIPASVMFSSDRKEVMQLLHQIVAAVEQAAIAEGYTNPKGFAGGSCKELFCGDQKHCRVLVESNPCPHKASARPSISGFGIDAVQLMKSSGWSAQIAAQPASSENDEMSWVAGLVILA